MLKKLLYWVTLKDAPLCSDRTDFGSGIWGGKHKQELSRKKLRPRTSRIRSLCISPPLLLRSQPPPKGFLSEDTVAKVKVVGKGEAGLEELAKYIPEEHIPDFLGGPSHTTVGPEDPLWADVDRAMSAWANGSDPFLDRRALPRVVARLRRERAAEDAAVTMHAGSDGDGVREETATQTWRSGEECSSDESRQGETVAVDHTSRRMEDGSRMSMEEGDTSGAGSGVQMEHGDVSVASGEAPRRVEQRARALAAAWEADKEDISDRDGEGGEDREKGVKVAVTSGQLHPAWGMEQEGGRDGGVQIVPTPRVQYYDVTRTSSQR